MLTIQKASELREQISKLRKQGNQIAFVPTMGNLHEGHMSLVDCAKEHAEVVVASIFVNPTQFGEGEDFDSYPRTLEEDSQKLENRGCDIVFTPDVNEMYPSGTQIDSLSHVVVPGISSLYCGASRPGHFTGVATVVSKLFNLVQPDYAIFGEKDFQQLAVIRKFSADLAFPIKIIGAPTIREESGLAMSSRNGYLTDKEKEDASYLYQSLLKAKSLVLDSGLEFDEIKSQIKQELKDKGFSPDYFEICDSNTLENASSNTKDFVILVAAFFGKPRLIDNLYFSK